MGEIGRYFSRSIGIENVSRQEIIGHMILGPSDEQYLAFSLNNVAHEVDLFIINDNGKNSKNRERLDASRFAQEGRLVYFNSHFEDFSQARNLCFDHTPPGDWKWLLWLDADEVHYPDQFSTIASIARQYSGTPIDGFIYHFWHLLSWRIYQSYEERPQLRRWDPDRRWHGKVHERLPQNGRYLHAPGEYVHYSYTVTQPEV